MVMTFTCNYRLHRRAGWSALWPAIFRICSHIIIIIISALHSIFHKETGQSFSNSSFMAVECSRSVLAALSSWLPDQLYVLICNVSIVLCKFDTYIDWQSIVRCNPELLIKIALVLV